MQIATNEVIKLLGKVKIFKGLDIEIIEDIATHVKTETFVENTIFVKHGQMGEKLFFIVAGKVEVRNPDNDNIFQEPITLSTSDVIGEISLLVNSDYTADIIALTDTTVLYLNRASFNLLLKKYWVLAEALSDLITSRMGHDGGINQVGRYELLGKLGQGAMSTVFNAYDSELEREVAIKMLKYHLAFDPEFISRFEQEAKLIASLRHPNIVNVHEVIAAYSTRFIVMEKLQGRNLSVIQKHKGPFSPDETRAILSQLAGALQYAHELGNKGIVHRDIKPSNIVLDESGNITLTDFGVAGPPSDREINIEGSPSYLAPEIINGGAVDYRADIYSLGVTAYYMLSGSLPFCAPTLPELLRMQIRQEAPDINKICPHIDQSLSTFINRALAKDKDERISDWKQIQSLFVPHSDKDSTVIDANETRVVIRLQNTTSNKTRRLLEALHEILQHEQQDYSIETSGNEKTA